MILSGDIFGILKIKNEVTVMFYVMRIEKRKRQDISGIQRENNRTAAEYNNRVNREQSELNLPLIQSDNWTQDIRAEIERAGARTRSNSVIALDTLYTASPTFFEGKTQKQTEDFFRDCLQFHQRQFGHIISAVIHYDETTPHLHVVSVPLTADGRLSAREIVGNKQNLSRLQDEFFEQVGRGYGLERGTRSDGQEKRKHISAQEKRMQELEQQVSDLSERVERLTEQTELTAAEYRDTYKKTAHINELRQQARQHLTTLNHILTDAERRQIEQEQEQAEQFPDFDDDFEDFTH
jgi:hypothetical protein